MAHNAMMRDPTTAPSRIFIGNIAENVTRPDIEERFGKYGEIKGVLITRNFAFVQYEKCESAIKATETENATMFCNRKLTVRIAVPYVKGALPGKKGGKGNQNQQNMQNQDGMSMNSNDSGDGNNFGNNGGLGGGGNFSGNRTNNFVPQNQPNIPPPPTGQFDQQNTNDCEIIVVSRNFTEYAEAIESRLKCCGLSVDLLFPNEDVHISKVISNISSRGCLYAILVAQQNVELRSITVNVLSGNVAEHRNMPVDDAINLIANDYHAQRNASLSQNHPNISNMPNMINAGAPMLLVDPSGLGPKQSPLGGPMSNINYSAPPLKERHPEAIQTMLNLLADNRTLTVLQYDRVLAYIKERRAQQVKEELGDDVTLADVVIPVPQAIQQAAIDQEIVVQKKILDIMNKPSITNHNEKPEKIDISSAGLLLLKDPKVQKALDWLILKTLPYLKQ